MPEDKIKEEQSQVSEQVDTKENEEEVQTPEDEDKAFNDEKDEPVENEPGEETIEKETEDEDETKKEDEEAETTKKDDEEKKEEEEADEDILRGQELIEAEESEKKGKEETETPDETKEDLTTKETAEFLANHPANAKSSPDFINHLHKSIPKELLPDNITLEDGTELDFQEIVAAYPAMPDMIAVITDNLLRQLIYNGVIPTTQGITDMFSDMDSGVDKKLFDRTVRNSVQEADKILESDDYKTWFKDQPKEIQALERSNNPADKVRLLNRFLNDEGLKDAKEKKKEKAESRAERKKAADAIHKTTVRNKSKKSPKSAMTPEEEEDAAFNSDDDDENFYL